MLEDIDVAEDLPVLERRAARRRRTRLNALVRVDCDGEEVEAGSDVVCQSRVAEGAEIAGVLERCGEELVTGPVGSIRMQILLGEVGDERSVMNDAVVAFEKLRGFAGRYKNSDDLSRDPAREAVAAAVSHGIDAAFERHLVVVPISCRTDPDGDPSRVARRGIVIAVPGSKGACRLLVGIDEDVLEIQLRGRWFTSAVHHLNLDVSHLFKNWLWGIENAVRETERAVLHQASALTVDLASEQLTDVRPILKRISEFSVQIERWELQLDVVDAARKDAAVKKSDKRDAGFIWRKIALSDPGLGLSDVIRRVEQLDAQVKRLLTIVTTATMAEQLRDSADRSKATDRVQRFALILAVLFTGPTLVATVLGAGVSGLHPGVLLYGLLLLASMIVCFLLLRTVGWPKSRDQMAGQAPVRNEYRRDGAHV
jgi:hypothetical protein